MKRRLPQEEQEDEEDDLSGPMFVGSPLRKQARADGENRDSDDDENEDESEPGPVPAPWDYEQAVADLDALNERIVRGSADVDDLREALRLTLGGSIGGLAGTVPVGGPPGPRRPAARAREPKFANVVRLYTYMWEALGEPVHAAALGAVRAHATGWPPTLADVVLAYDAVDPQWAGPYIYRVGQEAMDEEFSDLIAYELVGGLQGAVMRRAARDAARQRAAQGIAGGVTATGFIDPFGGDVWGAVVDPDAFARLEGCDPERTYFLFEQDAEEGAHMALFALAPGAREATLAASVLVPASWPAIAVAPFVPVPAARRSESGVPRLTPALQPYSDSVSLFLAALASSHPYVDRRDEDSDQEDDEEQEERESQIALTSALLEPIPAGAQQVKDAMLPMGSSLVLPGAVRRFMERTYDDPREAWYYGRTRGALIDECRLVLALRLFEGQVGARLTALRNRPRSSLTDLAARAYTGPLREGMAPTEALDRAAAYAWQGVCGAPALPSGRLADADRLLDVALLWGVEPDATEIVRPELLCGRLSGPVAERFGFMSM
ncbi:hypothetical protein pdul_cds_685 [Pandoravirus dulcis]|uniref:Uncharacterized protein n=1 Tax=Pandoravirus dulcis TaxID=1349409 RepID=S4VXP1_9VIRU|nr:hypothetical protein pdul_cds_685 [Pandoravirus dulcis]AGO82836.1 hypothetical protein pdul_cds_685 [Pandoravirus dulcis]